MARAATSPELVLYRKEGKWSKRRVAILQPPTVYTARINQTFSTWDGILELTYDTGSGTLANVLPDMTVLIGSTAGAHDIGIVRLRDKDSSKFYIGETSDVKFADNQFLTVVADFGLWARHVRISSGVVYIDGGVAYSDQHAKPEPTPIMGSNQVLKLTGSTIVASFSGSLSYVVAGLSSISSYAWSCSTASASSGTTTATPTFTFNSVGWHVVYMTITAANGKTYFGVRYVFVWNDSNLPPRARIDNGRQDVESGGWSYELTLLDHCDTDTIRDHALVIVFAEDYFGTTQSNIGPVAGSENVAFTGWIAKENINWNPQQGSVKFTAYTAHYWFGQIPAFPDGVEFSTTTPTAWTGFQNLTVAKGLWHFLHFRTTATRVMDVFLPDDTKYTKEVSSLASSLWEQIREMGFLQIYARAMVNAWNQLYIEVHPQLVPLASRTWPTVMTITKQDWIGEINFDRVTKPDVAVVSLSGVSVNSAGVGASFFALSPGHAYPHYGVPDMQDQLLVESQAQTNSLAGLYRGWKNNPFPEIPISLAADIRLIDCCPRAKCAISLATGDTPRGIAYSGNLIPIAVTVVTDPETGLVRRDVTFEAETFEDISINGDIPGSRSDVSIPPTPSLPPLGDFSFTFPGVTEASSNIPKKVLLHDPVGGFILLEVIDGAVRYRQLNPGLSLAQYQAANWMDVSPSGALYAAFGNTNAAGGNFLARAPSVGATFQIIYDAIYGLWGAGVNSLAGDQLCAVISVANHSDKRLVAGQGGSLATGAAVTTGIGAEFVPLSYGLGKWLHTMYDNYITISADGLSVTGGSFIGTGPAVWHVRVSSTGKTIHERNGVSGFVLGDNNLATYTLVSDAGAAIAGWGRSLAVDPTGLYMMARRTPGLVGGKSSDGGFSWSSAHPLGQNWNFAYAGPNGSTPKFMAAAASVYFTPDFGATWQDLTTAELWDITPFPAINMIKVLEYA